MDIRCECLHCIEQQYKHIDVYYCSDCTCWQRRARDYPDINSLDKKAVVKELLK